MSESVDLLRDTLIECAAAMRFKEANVALDKILVANWSGSRLYAVGYGWGRLWHWLYAILKVLFSSPWRMDHLKQAVAKTQRLFFAVHGKAQVAAMSYRKCLKGLLIGAPAEQSHDAARRKVLLWHEITAPLRRCPQVSQTLGLFPIESPLLKDMAQIAVLDGYLKSTLPLNLMRQMAYAQELSNLQEKEWKRFATALQQIAGQIPQPVKVVHKALLSASDLISEECHDLSQSFNPELRPEFRSVLSSSLVASHIERRLIEAGSVFLKNAEPKWVARRSAIRPTTKVRWENRLLTLGSVLRGDSASDVIEYSVLEDRSLSVAFSNNRLYLSLQHIDGEINSWGLRPRRFWHIDKKGFWGILERPSQFLCCDDWKSKGEICIEDCRKIADVVFLLTWLIRRKISLEPLSSTTLYRSEGEALRSTAVLRKVDYRQDLLEAFIREYSKGNRAVETYLMHASGLSFTPTAAFYRYMAEEAWNCGDISSEAIRHEAALREDLSDTAAVSQAEQLCLSIQDIKKQLLERFADSPLARGGAADLQRRIGLIFFECFAALGNRAQLPLDFFDDLVGQLQR